MNDDNSISTKTQNQVVIDNLQKSERDYLDLRTKLSEHGSRIDRYRKTAIAAREEESTAHLEWKSAIHSSGGEITKAIRDLKKQELAARETATEFENLLSELEPQFIDLQTVVCKARQSYLTTFERVKRINLDTNLEKAADAVLATEEGREFLALLLYRARQIENDCAFDDTLHEMASVVSQNNTGLTFDEFKRDVTTNRVQHFVFSFVKQHGDKVIETYHLAGEAEPASPFELSDDESSLIKASAAASRLKSAGLL